MNYRFLLLMVVFFGNTFLYDGAFAQNVVSSTSADLRLEASKDKLKNIDKSLYASIAAKNIGPTVQSGRVVDIEVNPESPHIFYVAYASGGLWKTINNGATFEPLFDHEMVMTIGDFDVNWETNEIWLGTGEVNSSRSSYSGLGMFYSQDAGKNWVHKGLSDSHHIGKVIIDPQRSSTIYVAVLGHLYSNNAERGVFKTTDGGVTWEKVLFISDGTGVVDLIMDPQNTEVLYAASWERSRRAWNFEEAGSESGIHKSEDGGESWIRVNLEASGFPNGAGTGRIGLSIAYDDYENATIYALVDNYNRRKADTEEKSSDLQKDDFKSMDMNSFRSLSEERLEEYLRNNNFPEKYTGTSVRKEIIAGKVKITDLAEYLEDANRMLFDTPVIGAELYKSTDGGEKWKKTHDGYLDRVYNSYGYYFGLVRAVPNLPSTVYIAGVPILKSEDGGKTFANMNRENVHADHHALWINPQNNKHIINGNDGGVNISYDAGENYFKCNSPSVGQFYYINADNNSPYNVYGGLQDNGVWYGSHKYNQNVAWHQSGHYPYKSIMGGDGMQIQIDNRDNSTVYTGFQFGNYFRLGLETEESEYITPKHELGDRPYRWNWQSPILLSDHNQDILYMGANKVLRSMNQGEDFKAISPDLTAGGIKGDVAFGTLTSISESPLNFGLIYTGSDDGMVYRTVDGGTNWTIIMKGIPSDYWVSRIQASSHDENVVYLSLNGYRWDNFECLVYRSANQGETWTRIGESIGSEPANVIKEDPHFANILYIGTDHGSYISDNTGSTFQLISNEIPKAPVHDIVIHKRDKDLLIGTHGRSIYKIDLEPIYDIQQTSASLLANKMIKRRASGSWGNKNWLRKFNVPDSELVIYSAVAGKAKLTIETLESEVIYETKIDLVKGFNYHLDHMQIDSRKEKSLRKYLEEKDKLKASEDGNIYLRAGEYKYVVEMNDQKTTTKLVLK